MTRNAIVPDHPASPAKQLAGFIAKFDPKIARLARSARVALRKHFPTAVELVYDNYNALAIGWGSNERASEVITGRGYTVIKSISVKQRPRRTSAV